MKRLSIILVLAAVLAGCASYHELKPEPPVSIVERGYIELHQKDGPFKLEKGKKYFLNFPMSSQDKFYLILVTRSKDTLSSFVTGNFDKGKEGISPINDETVRNESTMVYDIGRKFPVYTWVIDTVRADMSLALNYRYVPQWRYTFEQKFAQFQKTLSSTVYDRATYLGIGPDADMDRLDIAHELSAVGEKNAALKTMREELLRLDSLFPEDIVSSKDTAYEHYTSFRARVEDEWNFQDNYTAVLRFFAKEKETRGSVERFIEASPGFIEFINQRDRFSEGVVAKATQVYTNRLSEILPFLEGTLKDKSDIAEITLPYSREKITSLYEGSGQQLSNDIRTLYEFVNRFNVEADSVAQATAKLEAVQSYYNSHRQAPTEAFFQELMSRLSTATDAFPELKAGTFRKYGKYDFVKLLSAQNTSARTHAEDLLAMYRQAGTVASEVKLRSWASAERDLKHLFEWQIASSAPEIPEQRASFVKAFENAIFSGVKAASHDRIDAFVRDHGMDIDSVARLYSDSAFLPVYVLTFSSGEPAELVTKRKDIDAYLDQVKYYQFPENSIKIIYDELVRHMADHGVEKARAIVAHGTFYKGSDKQVKNLISECNVEIPKTVLHAKEYRKLFALPVTSKAKGKNDYLFRIRLQIPTDAQFPVYDVNIKLPPDVARNAASSQWYQSITIDKKPVKNEGRFRITAPTAENDYETLITPLQVTKNGKNILEVRFRCDGFKVFEVSAMAQVPIIRKD